MIYQFLLITSLTLCILYGLPRPILSPQNLSSIYVRSTLKLHIYLLKRYFFLDIPIWIIVTLFLLVSGYSLEITLSSLIIFFMLALVVRITQVSRIKNYLGFSLTPWLLSIYLNNASLIIFSAIISTYMMGSILVTIYKRPWTIDKKESKLSINKPLFLITLLLVAIGWVNRDINKKIEDFLPIYPLILCTYIETTLTKNKINLQRYRNNFNLVRVRKSALNLMLLGINFKNIFVDFFLSIFILMLYMLLIQKSIMLSVSTILIVTTILMSSIDLITQHDLTNRSIVYSNFVTRIIASQMPSFICFTYVTSSLVFNNSPDLIASIPIQFLPILISILIFLTLFYIYRYVKLYDIKKAIS